MSTTLEQFAGAPQIKGIIAYNKNWYLLQVPATFHQMLVEQLENEGEIFKPNAHPHISVIKNEAPSRNQADWGTAFIGEEVSFQYNTVIKKENGLHFWIDCYSPRLCEMREHFGLTTLKKEGDEKNGSIYMVNFHMTIGRRKKPTKAQLRPQYRLSPQSHIDVETGMQHL
ncbi:hypothetical protein BKI52_30475 [marine bacterium AO1-C]|nr:hypothetical protein BKI52_30475 [marine bacterium AO1-C]